MEMPVYNTHFLLTAPSLNFSNILKQFQVKVPKILVFFLYLWTNNCVKSLSEFVLNLGQKNFGKYYVRNNNLMYVLCIN